MKYFLFPLVIGLVAIAGLNLYVDATNSWWRTKFSFAKNWDHDQCWVTPIRMDERRPRLQHIEVLPKIDLLGLGSSRFFTVDTNMMPEGAHFYNASVAGATIWDYVAIWEKFKQQGNIPKHMIIYVDTWNFNKNTWQKYRWLPSFPLIIDFLNESDGKYDLYRNVQITALMDWLSGTFYEFSDLFSPAILKVSLQEINILRKTGSIKSNYISAMENRPTDFPAWMNDGSFLYPQGDLKPKTLAQITEIGRNTGLGGMYMYMKDWETDTVSIALMNYLLADTEKYGVDVLLVQPPFQHETLEIIKNNPDYKKIPDNYKSIVSALLQSHKKVSYCDVQDPRTAACTETEFMDSAHTLKPCAQKIINYCLRKVPQWYE